MPAHSYKRILVMYAAFKNHVSLFPGTPAIRTFKQELAKYKTSGSTVKFPLDKPVPAALIRRLVAWRVKEALEKDGKWRTENPGMATKNTRNTIISYRPSGCLAPLSV